jgi:glycosyltransferase involved in cell wall biosynthesis
MKVVLDLQGTQTESRHRGIGRYTMALARGILRNAGDHDVWVGLTAAIPETIPAIRETLADLLPDNRLIIWNSVAPTGDAHAVNDGRRTQAQVVREAFLASLDADIVHCSSVFEGLEANSVTSIHRHFQGPPTAATLYDLIPLVDRSRYLADGQMERWYRQRLAELRRADLLLAISEHTQHEAYRLLGLPPERVVNIRAGADAIFAPQTVSTTREAGLRKRFGLTKPFVMFTGGLDARKNIKGLISAFAMLPPELRETHQLALVGHADEKIDQSNLDHALAKGLRPDQVVLTGFVSDEDMVTLYNLSTGFVFPSQYEGFGLPPLEAMSCGTPTIASNTTSIPEVVGDPEAMFDPYDTADISRKMSRLLTDATYRDGLRTRGLERAKTFSWDDSAIRTLAAFEKLVRSQKPKRTARSTPQQLPATPRRPRLALVTGVPKRPSADRDRLVQLVEQLDLNYAVDIVTGLEVEPGDFEGPARLVSSEHFDEVSGVYDRIVHRYANSADFGHVRYVQARHPGLVLLEDYYLDRALTCGSGELDPSGAWMQAVIEAHGYNGLHRAMKGRAPGDPAPRLPLYSAILSTAHGVMVTDQRITDLASEDLGTDATKGWVTVPLLLPVSGTDAGASRPQSIAAFGVGIEHLHHRLVSAWLASRELNRDSELLIVGPGQHDAYGRHLSNRLQEAHAGGRWKVISPDDTLPDLGSIRFAVKLSGDQDSATDRWLQACEARGIPILTADELGDTLDERALASALETAWHRETPMPAAALCGPAPADAYRDAVEQLHAHGRLTQQLDILRVAGQQPALSADDWSQTVLAVLRNHPVPDAPRQLLLDLTMMVQVDARTGIQRVTRSLARCLLDDPPEGFRVEPIYSDEDGELRYARNYAAAMLGFEGARLRDEPVVVRKGDVLAGLDLNDRMFPSETMTGPSMAPALEWLRSRGVGRQFVVYDLLPCSHPGWFPWPDHWFPTFLHNLVRYADAVICISQATAHDMTDWIADNAPERAALPVDWFHLGADIEKSVPSDHMTDDFEKRWAKRGIGPSILMVGTIEPRKGHDQALAAFTSLWNDGVNANLVIVGQAGWGRDELLQTMAMHPEWGRRLLWFEGASDAELMRLYRVADGCLMPSRGEGFGLPLIEAARYDIPVLARDLPVFEEIAQDNVTYFSGKSAKSLATALKSWFAALAAGTAPRSGGIEWMTWDQSTQQFVAALRRHLAD